MQEPRAFCRAVMHEYERQWAIATGHGVRHPLRVKMEALKGLADEVGTPAEFEARLLEDARSDDARQALLAGDLLPLWKIVAAGGQLPFPVGG